MQKIREPLLWCGLLVSGLTIISTSPGAGQACSSIIPMLRVQAAAPWTLHPMHSRVLAAAFM